MKMMESLLVDRRLTARRAASQRRYAGSVPQRLQIRCLRRSPSDIKNIRFHSGQSKAMSLLGRKSIKFTLSQITGRFDQELIDVLPSSLRFVSHNGAGYDSIDAAACAARGNPLPLSHQIPPTKTSKQASPSQTHPVPLTLPQLTQLCTS